MADVSKIVTEVKAGIKTSEFYLASFVALSGVIVQFLPTNVADATVKVASFVAALLAALGYTGSRTAIKLGSK